MYARMYVCQFVFMHVCQFVFMYVCQYVCMHVCMSVCIYACMYFVTNTQLNNGASEAVSMYVWMYVFINHCR